MAAKCVTALQQLLPLLYVTIAVAVAAGLAQASLPAVNCNQTGCEIKNWQRVWVDRSPCRVAQVVFPTTEAELVAAVAAAVRNGTKLKVVSKWAHSVPKLVCPPGESGILISTRDYVRNTVVDAQAGTVTVDAGVQLQDLVKNVGDNYGLALPHAPYWGGLSISGLLSTGAHGSGLWGKGSAVHEYLTGIRIVVPAAAAQGYAVVKTFTAASNPNELAAAKVSLGVLGAISQVTLQLQPLFKRNLTYDLRNDSDLETRLVRISQDFEFGDVAWYPTLGKALYRMDNRVPLTTSGDGSYDFLGFRPMPVETSEAARAQGLLAESTRNSLLKKTTYESQLAALTADGYGLYNNRNIPVFLGYPVIGLNHRIQTSSSCTTGPLDTQIPEDPLNLICTPDLGPKGNFFFLNGASLPISKMAAFIQDVRQLLAQRPLGLVELDGFNGILMRFVKGNSSAYLGASEDSVDMDFGFLRANNADDPRLDEDVLEEFEQMVLFKYGGEPHWGKNRPLAFIGAAAKHPRLQQFLAVKQQLDPQGLFSNTWTDAVLGINGSVTEVKPFCALEGLCICSEDVHCAPNAGYFCRPGLVYQQARVCRFQAS